MTRVLCVVVGVAAGLVVGGYVCEVVVVIRVVIRGHWRKEVVAVKPDVGCCVESSWCKEASVELECELSSLF